MQEPDLEAAVLDATLYPGEPYLLLGQSTQVRHLTFPPPAPNSGSGNSSSFAPPHARHMRLLHPVTRSRTACHLSQAQGDATSVSHGRIAATELDTYGHVRGDILPGGGDSGGAVFSAVTGKLIGMCVGADHNCHKSVLVPSTIIQRELAALGV